MIKNTLSDHLVDYLVLVAKYLIEDDEEAWDEKDIAWDGLSPDDKDLANEFAHKVFGEWL